MSPKIRGRKLQPLYLQKSNFITFQIWYPVIYIDITELTKNKSWKVEFRLPGEADLHTSGQRGPGGGGGWDGEC